VRHISAHGLKGKQKKRLASARRVIYRKVLRDPGASEGQKREARLKLNALTR